jgi:hypothetical protein
MLCTGKLQHNPKYETFCPSVSKNGYSYPEVGAGAFFALSRWRARSEKKSAKARRKKSAKKSESAERERKKARIRAFSSTQSGNPVSEPKAARQGEKQRS